MQRRKGLTLEHRSYSQKSLRPSGSYLDRLGNVTITQMHSQLIKPELNANKERTSMLQTRRDKLKLKKRTTPRVHVRTLAVLEAVSKLETLTRRRLNLSWKACSKILTESSFKRPMKVIADEPQGREMTELKEVVENLKMCITGVAGLARPAVDFARCPNCAHQGLVLLTSSTKDNLSPKLLDKVKALLPKSQSFTDTSNELIQRQSSKPQREEGFSLPKPEQKMNLHDISAIHPNQSVIDSFENASIIKRQPSKPRREQISFDVISDSTRVRQAVFDRESTLPSTNSTLRVPRLNISDLVPTKVRRYMSAEPLKSPSRASADSRMSMVRTTTRKDGKVLQGLGAIAELYRMRMRWTFDMVFLSRAKAKEPSLNFEFSCEDIDASSVIDPMVSTFGLNDQPIWSPIGELDQLETLKFEESSVIDRAGSKARKGVKLLGFRLEKLVYLRVAATFNRLSEL